MTSLPQLGRRPPFGQRWPSPLLGRRGAFVLVIAFVLGGCGQLVPSAPTIDREGRTTGPSVGGLPATPVADTPAVPLAGSSGDLHLRVVRSDLQLPSARTRAVAFSFGSSILVCGGLTGGGTTTGSILGIDLAARQVSQVGRLGSPVHDAGGAVLQGSGFIFGGGMSAPDSIVQRVDPTGAAAMVGKLPAARADLASVAVGGELVLVGGGTPIGPIDEVIATTDGRRFAAVARLLVGVRYSAAAAVGGIVYVIGGSTPTGDTRVIQAVDPKTGSVRIVARLPTALSHATAFVVGDVLLIAGGRTAGQAQSGLWQLDLTDGTTVRVGRLPYAVSDAAAVVVGGTGYLIGGEGRAPIASIIEVTAR